MGPAPSGRAQTTSDQQTYGSRARDDARTGSDVDLAVSLHPSGSLLDDARLHDQLATALDRDDVDLLILDSAPLWLQYFRPYHDSYLAAVRERAPWSVERWLTETEWINCSLC